MADKSAIEWCDSTWNPTRGCSRVSPGCGGPGHAGGCYAEGVAARFSNAGFPYHGFAERKRTGSKWTGKVALIDHMLAIPLRWKEPRRIFVNSMSDLFHEALSDSDIDKVFAVMALCSQHTFQVLTKRPQRMADYISYNRHSLIGAGDVCTRIATAVDALSDDDHIRMLSPQNVRRRWPLPNVWLGVSVEDQTRADERIPLLLETPAAVRFLSCEPLLGPVDLRFLQPGDPPVEIDALAGTHGVLRPHRGISPRLDWVIAGGESGPRARPMHPAWARSLRDQCAAAEVPFFFKQQGDQIECREGESGAEIVGIAPEVAEHDCAFDQSAAVWMRRVGKKAAGRLLDGREHNDFPASV
jgi:protein gp37